MCKMHRQYVLLILITADLVTKILGMRSYLGLHQFFRYFWPDIIALDKREYFVIIRDNFC